MTKFNPKKHEELIGSQLGRWTVLELAERSKSGAIRYKCRCTCGTERAVIKTALVTGKSKGCGCLRKEQLREKPAALKYENGEREHPLYNMWRALKERCYNPKHTSFKYYGAKGVGICNRWHFYEYFYEDLIDAYEEHAKEHSKENTSIDRINPCEDYVPCNVRFATWEDQANNKRAKED